MTTMSYYDEGAAAYDRLMSRLSRLDTPALLAAAKVTLGDRVLDVATGTGEVALAAASIVGRSGVVGVDLSLGMLRTAARKAADKRVAFVAMDGQALAVRGESFDVVLCRLALMVFPDPLRGLREFRRVLRPGGRVAVSVWPPPDRMPMYGIVYEALARQLPDEREVMRGFSLSDASRLEELLATAGFFHDICVTRDVRRLEFDSFEDYWNPFQAGASRVGQIYRRLPEGARRAVIEEVRGRVAHFESEGRLVMDVESLFGLGWRE